MSTWSIQENYYSGQGVCMLGLRTAGGKPARLRPIGNVSDLKLTVATSVLEHKESTTGQRGTDLRITTETKVGIAITMENFNRRNLADVLRGLATEVLSGSIVALAVTGYVGSVIPLNKLSLTAVAVKIGATTLTPYVDEVTPYDYKLNASAGSIEMNPGTTIGYALAGAVPSVVTPGATTAITVANTAVVGEYVYLQGFTGAGAAALNGKFGLVTVASPTALTVAINTTALTITVAAGTRVVSDNMPLLVDMTWANQYQVDALTQGAAELWMRFEGLNTADGNSPVVVDVFRVLADPLKELSLISDTVQQFVLEGSVLADNLQATGSKYFRAQKLS